METKLIIRMIAPLKRSIASITSWGKVHSSDESGFVQASFLTDETIDKVPLLHPFGFLSRPRRLSKCFAICNGNRRNLKIIAVEGKAPISLSEGECLLYTENGNYAHLKKDGAIELKAKKILLRSGNTNLISIVEDLLEKLETKACSDKAPLFTAADFKLIKEKIGKFK